MTAVDGRSWIAARYSPGQVERVAAFLAMVVTENSAQNLIAPSTVDAIWERHALDSAQLLEFDPGGRWIDIGTGGGFPGVVVAILREEPVVLVEPRARRAAFLERCVIELGVRNATVFTGKVERLEGVVSEVVSARAVAGMPALLDATRHCSSTTTRWVFPRGRSGQDDLASLRRSWHGVFHVEQSIVDPESAIIILDKVRRR